MAVILHDAVVLLDERSPSEAILQFAVALKEVIVPYLSRMLHA